MKSDNIPTIVKRTFFYGCMALIMAILLELGAQVLLRLVDEEDFFDHRDAVLASLNEKDLAVYREKIADEKLGWGSRGPGQYREKNCLGIEVRYNYGQNGARVHDLFEPDSTSMIFVGDSYTHGNETTDNKNYVARLAQLTGLSAANHGVGGFGPTQSLLNLQDKLERYPKAEITVLGIMYENLYRMVNSYRPAIYNTSTAYALKPYTRAGQIHAIPPGSFDSLSSFKAQANRSFDSDFWAKPQLKFPYLYSLKQALTNNYFYFRQLQKGLRDLGMQEYSMVFMNDEIVDSLLTLLTEYSDWAEREGVRPIVLFIPRNRLDLTVIQGFLAKNSGRLPSNLIVGDVAQMPDVNWQEFNLEVERRNDLNICHPSEYGYSVIAEYLAGLMRSNGLLDGT